MSVFVHENYRQALRYSIDRYRRQKPFYTQTLLAEKSGIHNTFISNVLKGRSDFNPDQIFAIGELLGLHSGEIDFVVLLLEWEKSIHSVRKELLKQQIENTRRKELKLGKLLETEDPKDSTDDNIEYYLNPYYLVIHTALNLNAYAQSPTLLSHQLKLSEDYVRQILKRLEDMQFIKFNSKKNRYEVLVGSRHLDKTSPLCIPHQTLLRNQGLRQMGELKEEKRNFFSATFLGSEKLRKQIEKEFYQFTQKAKKLADSNKSSDAIFQMNFDLFPWTQE